jgi:prepilin-type processing-associated H-X9-DG protein
MPAVQRVRESANQTHCLNNLKQIGMAMHNYEGVHTHLPPGYLFIGGPTTPPPPVATPSSAKAIDSMFWLLWGTNIPYMGIDTAPGWGWGSYLLPHLEQGNLEQDITYKERLELPKYAALRVAPVPTYICPSDSGTGVFTVFNEFNTPLVDCHTNSYVASWGQGADIGEQPDNGSGLFFRNSKVRISSISDGSSNTLAVGERAALFAKSPWVGAVTLGSIRTTPGAPVYLAAVEEAPTQVLARIGNLPLKDPYSTPYDFFSGHPQIVNFLFADGSARGLSTSISPVILRALATRAGKELINPDSY